MKKNTLKAFTLVEMLIVIVIIGILIAALLPRMQAAQGRARDVARKTALSQIQSAIVTHQGDHGSWPWSGTLPTSPDSVGIDQIHTQLINAGMSDVPKDPLNESTVKGLGTKTSSTGQFLYMVSTRNGSSNAGFVLMAKTEVAGGSNRVVCNDSTTPGEINSGGNIGVGADLAKVKLCPSVEKAGDGQNCNNPNNGTENCKYKSEDQLRYIVLY